MDPDRTKRREILKALTPRFRKIVTAAFVRNPQLPAVDRIHPSNASPFEATASIKVEA